MDAPNIFSLARELTKTNASDYPDSRLLPFLNAVKDDFWSYIITWVSSKYNWDIWHVDETVLNQSEYVRPEAASDAEGNLKINNISVCYDGGTYADGKLKYEKAREVDINNLPLHWNWYVNNQPATDPIYYIADKSIFIAPAFKTNIPNGIELKGIRSIEDYTVTTTESDIKIPSYLHNDLVQWILPYILKSQRQRGAAKEEEARYEARKEQAAQKIANRTTGPSYMKYPDNLFWHDDPYTITISS